MTAIVGILNKRAAAIAADSAMTVKKDGQTKIYNNARKIFSLSEDIPVGIMMAGNLEFMGMPWDVIFGQYRSYRNGKPLPHLKDYMSDFLSFLTSFSHLNTKEMYSNYLYAELGSFYYTTKSVVDSRISEEQGKIIQHTFEEHLNDVMEENVKMYKDDGRSENMKEISFKKFCAIAKKQFESLKETMSEDGVSTKNMQGWKRVFYEYIISSCYLMDSQIVFTGYGEDEIYPSIQAVALSGIIDGKVRFRYDDYEEITDESSSIVMPFAQSDVMVTLMKGIAPELYANIMEKLDEHIEKVRELMITSILEAGYKNEIKELMESVSFSDLNKTFRTDTIDYIQEHYIEGMLAAIDCFSVSEMADMAENLISVTGLQRHYTSSEESVGGPVNVAVITKDKGFRWVKMCGKI
ncbi:MAG: hypothetical protein MJY73_06255 [Bacteroidales bacterium]|nr:hypothetical protein [Bacteroidales bacterium]